MRTRPALLAAALAVAAFTSQPTSPLLSQAHASVSTAATLEGLITGANVVVLADALESRSEWQGGRIFTYTKLKVVERINGDAPDTVWVKTLGGMVGHIGQSVEGEPLFSEKGRSLVFLRRINGDATPDAHMVVSRAQGQFPLAMEKARWMVRVGPRQGLVLPPREAKDTPAMVLPKQPALARLKDRPVDDVVREVHDLWTQLHAKKTP